MSHSHRISEFGIGTTPKEKAPAYRNRPGTNNQGASTTPISAPTPSQSGQNRKFILIATTPKKKPQLIEISQGQIIRVHLPLLYPHLPHLNQDKTKNWWG
jgi:hypothetical protein